MSTNWCGVMETAIALAARTSDAEHYRDNEDECGRRTTGDDVREVRVDLL